MDGMIRAILIDREKQRNSCREQEQEGQKEVEKEVDKVVKIQEEKEEEKEEEIDSLEKKGAESLLVMNNNSKNKNVNSTENNNGNIGNNRFKQSTTALGIVLHGPFSSFLND